MKRFYTVFIILCLSLTIILPSNATGVLCNSNKTSCTLGKYTLKDSKIYIGDGIMCNSNKTLCTNGNTVYQATAGGEIKVSRTNKKNETIMQVSAVDALNILAELYSEGLILQNEYNRVKANINNVDIDKIIELKKVANLYKNRMVTQSEYNRAKKQILG